MGDYRRKSLFHTAAPSAASSSTKLAAMNPHFSSVKTPASASITGVGCGKRHITSEVATFSRKSKSIPSTGAKLASCQRLPGWKALPHSQLMEVTRKNVYTSGQATSKVKRSAHVILPALLAVRLRPAIQVALRVKQRKIRRPRLARLRAGLARQYQRTEQNEDQQRRQRHPARRIAL